MTPTRPIPAPGAAPQRRLSAAAVAATLALAVSGQHARAIEGHGGIVVPPPVVIPRPIPEMGVPDPSVLGAPPPAPVDWGAVESSIRTAAESGANRDSWWQRGVSGITPPFISSTGGWDNRENSCVGAAEARARDVAASLQTLFDQGKLGNHSVTVGTRNGYQVFGASFHTYTVVEIRNAKGDVVKTYAVDNYLAPLPTSVATQAQVSFDPVTGDSNVVQQINPPPKKAPAPRARPKPQTQKTKK